MLPRYLEAALLLLRRSGHGAAATARDPQPKRAEPGDVQPCPTTGQASAGDAAGRIPTPMKPDKFVKPDGEAALQKLHLVMGGRVCDPQSLEFADIANLDLVGVYGSYAEAKEAWQASAHRTVDDAEMKYVIVHLHRLLQPGSE